jgi:ureidoglycolate dehydrogenase (NAD+)
MKRAAVVIAPADLGAFVSALFAARGMRPADAETVAEVLLWADLRGTASHGVSRVPNYLGMIDKGQLDPVAIPEMRVDLGAVFSLDAQRSAGPVAMMAGLAGAQTRARAFGIGMALVSRTTHTGAIGCYAEKAAQQGFAAIVLGAGPPIMAYHGARIPSVSTAPVAIAVPGGPSGAIVLDMASSIVANGRLKQAQQTNEPIPEGWALDADGRSTTDPAQASIPLPMGGAKGAGLALMNECLTSVLAGAPILSAMLGPNGKRAHVQNATIILIDIARFRPVDAFMSDIDLLSGIIHSLPRMEGVDEIRLPGERGAAEAARRRASGVRVSAKSWQDLVKVAGELGVPPPAINA